MKEKTTKKSKRDMTLSERLADNLKYYIDNTNRRCVDRHGDSRYHGKTLGKNTKGCFVGSLLPAKTREWADNTLGQEESGVNKLLDVAKKEGVSIPRIIKNNRHIMEFFQHLHDSNTHWTRSGLSLSGVDYLAYIIAYNRDELDIEPFKEVVGEELLDEFMDSYDRWKGRLNKNVKNMGGNVED